MSNETEVQNINALTEEQKQKVERAKEIMAVLDKEPAMVLYPFLRYSESGVRPDVRLEFKTQPNEPTENEGAGEAGEGATTNDEPVEPSDAPGRGTDPTN